MADDTHACVPCGLHEPRRNAYFDGKLLLARDFEDEQVFHIAKQQLLNTALHGTGTACGLKIVQHPAADCRATFAVVEPGLALDCCGREIIVTKKAAVPIGALLDADPELRAKLDGTRDLIIAIERCDRRGEIAPVILADCEGAAEGGKPGRIIEGFDFALFAATPGELAPVAETLVPQLDWRQTLTFAQAMPAAMAFDEDRGHAYVAVVPAGEEASRIFVYERRNHDIVTALDGPARPTDIAVSPVGNQVYVAAAADPESEGAGARILVWRKSAIRDKADAFATIALDSAARLAVSPRTGALFALLPESGTIIAWSQESIDAWAGEALPDPAGPADPVMLTLDDWDARDTDANRGSMFAISPDGSRLVAVDGPAARPVRLIDVALLFGGEEATAFAAAALPAGERAVAATWSLDSRFVFLFSQGGDDEEPRAILRRYEQIASDGSLQQRGRGVSAAATAIDLAVAPGERWAYALVARAAGERTEATLLALDMEEAKLSGDAPSPDGVRADVALPGIGLSQQLVLSGRQLYIALQDEDLERQPDRGLVAVIEPEEGDCGARFRAAIDNCPTCHDAKHRVVLAHVARYVAADRPRLVDRDPHAGEAAIDNITYRPLVPSAQTLRQVVECILTEGVAEGPPGPRGDPGDAGVRGPGIQEAAAVTLAAGQAATVTLAPVTDDAEGDLLLTIGIPRGANGSNGSNGMPGGPGPRGPGIQEVVANTLNAGQPATAALTPIAGDAEGDLRLTLGIPRGSDGSVPVPDLGRISALSWRHDVAMGGTEIDKVLTDIGIAIGFDRPVQAATLTHPEGPDFGANRSLVFDVLARREQGITCLCPVFGTVELLKSFEVDDGVIVAVSPSGGEELVMGIRMTFNSDSVRFDRSFMRVMLRCDFVIDEKGQPIDGNFLAGKLPTGDGVAGGLFESWLFIKGGD